MKLSQKEVMQILINFNIGEIKSITRLTSGYANINYKLTTTKGNYLFRICKNKEEKEILYEMKVLEELQKINFPAAFPVVRKDGNYINKSKYGNVVIYEYIEGEEPKINPQTVTEIAKAVAALNSFENWQSLEKENAISIDLCNDLITRFDESKNKHPEIFDFFKIETFFLFDILKKDLPKGLVHGDIFTDNTKFKGNKLLAIFDFEEVCTDNLLYDIGVTINGFCFKNNKLDRKLMNTFLKEYNCIRKITSKEYELLPYYIEWGAFAMIYWHLSNIIYQKDPKKLKRLLYFVDRIQHLKKTV